jgi:hypothetical protein
MDDRRNPYLILGIPYGASRGEARRAAVARTRELRQRQKAVYAPDDVNWALHQVEQVLDDPDSAVGVFRVPAAPGVLDAPTREGLFNPKAEVLDRTTTQLSDEDYDRIRREAAAAVSRRVIEALGPYIVCWPPDPSEEEGSNVHVQDA